MSAEANRSLVNRYAEEAINQGRLEVIDEICAVDYRSYPPGFPEGDRELDKQLIAMFRSAFPDMHKRVDELVADGEVVIERATYSGTHAGEFMGIPPTGRKVTFNGMHLFRIVDGKIAETRGIMDQMGMLQQLGVMPSPEKG
jgi:steroid delta-isomerase-like uncharacterized protein